MIETITLSYNKEALKRDKISLSIKTDNKTSVVILPFKRLTRAIEAIFNMEDDKECKIHSYDFNLYHYRKDIQGGE